MKVCYYVRTHPLLGRCEGGAERQLYLIGKGLQKYDWEVHYLLDRVKDYSMRNVTLFNQHLHMIETPQVSPIKNLPFLTSPSNPNYERTLNKINPDIYHQRGSNIATGYFANSAKEHNKPFIFSIAHIDDCTLQGSQWDTFAKRTLKKKLYLYGIEQADVVIATAEYLKTAFLKQFPDKKVVVIPSGHPVPKKIEKEDSKIVLWIGRQAGFKNIEGLERFARAYPEYSFVAVGNVQIPNPPRNLYVAGFVPEEIMEFYLKHCAVLLDTSHSAGFPNTFIQAWLHSTPVYSLHVNPDNVLHEYEIGMQDPNFNSDNFGELMENKKLRIRMGNNAYRYAKEHHDIEKTVLAHKKLYEELIK